MEANHIIEDILPTLETWRIFSLIASNWPSLESRKEIPRIEGNFPKELFPDEIGTQSRQPDEQ
jgi:hypothetical protein